MLEGFNLNAMDPAYVMALLKGVEAKTESVFEDVFAPEEVELMSGKVPFVPSKYTLLSDDDNFKGKIAVDDVPDILNVDLDSVAFGFDGKYSHEARIHKKDVEQLADQGLEGAEDLVQYLGMLVKGFINTSFDMAGATVLQSQTLNATQAVTGTAWSDESGADIFGDLDAMEDVVGQPEVLWLGLDYAREARGTKAIREAAKHPDVRASTGRVSRGALSEILVNEYDLEEVIIDGTRWKNTANQAQSINKGRVFDGTIWMGRYEHMMALKKDAMDEADSEYKGRSQEYCTYAHKYREIARAETDRGVVLTGA